ncbi:MAG TPA: SET domain-containing protein-lysine N-methyltransferase [Burkholderiaceae bacterium]|jgi:SET domain-containing protein|nr:SET domain-containing protein-lysine N-methyltransferase [Burkholderiaceae bacterium]HRA77589.1 SET domain-containing protein-lysine N-methyltransferase [Burkholderiaceae bacterium]
MPNRIVTRRSPIHGNGVFAAADIPAGTRLIQYRGRLMTHAQSDELYGDETDSGHTFLFSLNDDYVIDANRQGNGARWINHSCAPNCEAVLDEDPGGNRRRDRVFIESIRDIRQGEELTYNYGIVLEVPHTRAMKRIWACRCGAPQCTGTLLQPKRRRA